MGLVYAIANQKGGVGKTTTVVNLAAYFGARGKRVLCIDIDPQGNTTTGLGIKKRSLTASSYHVLNGSAKIADVIQQTEYLIPLHRPCKVLHSSFDCPAAR